MKINLTQNEIHEVKAAVSAEIKRLEKLSADYSDSPDSVYKMLAERSNQSICRSLIKMVTKRACKPHCVA